MKSLISIERHTDKTKHVHKAPRPGLLSGLAALASVRSQSRARARMDAPRPTPAARPLPVPSRPPSGWSSR